MISNHRKCASKFYVSCHFYGFLVKLRRLNAMFPTIACNAVCGQSLTFCHFWFFPPGAVPNFTGYRWWSTRSTARASLVSTRRPSEETPPGIGCLQLQGRLCPGARPLRVLTACSASRSSSSTRQLSHEALPLIGSCQMAPGKYKVLKITQENVFISNQMGCFSFIFLKQDSGLSVMHAQGTCLSVYQYFIVIITFPGKILAWRDHSFMFWIYWTFLLLFLL